VGRTGDITPVANLKPVQVAGTTVKRSSLYNADEIARLDLHELDWVHVEKGGEIIPKITSVNTEKRDLFAQKINYIQACPECGTELIRKEGEAIHYCPNDSHCKPQLIGRLEHFVSRKAMNIDGLGAETVAALFQKNLVRTYADLYALTFEQLNGLSFELEEDETGKIKKRSIKDKSAENIINGIAASKSVPFERVLFALGIRMVGETVAKKLAQHFETIENLMDASAEQMSAVHEIGEKIAENVLRFFSDADNRMVVLKLKEQGLNLHMQYDPTISRSDILAGKTFLVSGTFWVPEVFWVSHTLWASQGLEFPTHLGFHTRFGFGFWVWQHEFDGDSDFKKINCYLYQHVNQR
jgi:DNA ligase (NAD+)